MQTEPIYFPILYRFDRHVVAAREDIVRIWWLKHCGSNRFQMPESPKRKARLKWMLDSRGLYREAILVAERFSFLRPLSWLFPGPRIVFELTPGRVVSVGFLQKAAGGSSADSEKSSAPAFRRYLARFPAETEFDRAMFIEFMREPEGGKVTTFPKQSLTMR